jgi:excisionase family DNA binding protein
MAYEDSSERIRLGPIPPPREHTLITVSQTARMLGCSPMTIRRRIEARVFPAVTIGRKSMIPREFVEAMVKAAKAGRTIVLEEFIAEWTAQNAIRPLHEGAAR